MARLLFRSDRLPKHIDAKELSALCVRVPRSSNDSALSFIGATTSSDFTGTFPDAP
jgi:hypothetical protein